LRVAPNNEGHAVKVFVDTGANFNIISRKFYEILVAQGLKYTIHPGPTKGFNINLVNRFYMLLVTELLSRPKFEQVRGIFSLVKIF